jgi:hypothetical protein
MSQLTQALVGWLVIMGMVLGGVGVLFFVMSAIRALVTIARRAKVTAPGPAETPAIQAPSAHSR